MGATMAINEQFNGIELAFDARPDSAVLDTLKAAGFRWHNVKKLWYAKNDEKRLELARGIADGEVIEHSASSPEKAEKKREKAANKYGVQVGDIFSASWGYDQTNTDFFQVVELVGSESVRVREVCPEMTDERPTCSMAADRKYKITRELLPPSRFSVFIKDQERGDLKRIKSYSADGVSNPLFRLSSYADAYLCRSDSVTTYESWYA